MTVQRTSGVQRAVDFLTSPELADLQTAMFPPHVDYESLAAAARNLGYDLSPGTIEEAFRLVMRARLFTQRSAKVKAQTLPTK